MTNRVRLQAKLVGRADLRYTPAGGTITVQLKTTASGARVAISDTGCGISEQHIPRLTERFYRVDVGRSRETGGTGLGLSIVKHALDHYRSKLEIKSQLGKGSTFAFTIPAEFIVEDVPRHAPDSSRAGQNSSGR